MNGSASPQLVWMLCLALAGASSGCAAVLEEGLRGLADDDGPPGTEGQYGAPGRESDAWSTLEDDRKENRPDERAPVTTGYQYAPTLYWLRGTGTRPFTPGRSIFERMSPSPLACQAVPMGLTQVYSGPTGPTAWPLSRAGPLELGLAGPFGTAHELAPPRPDAVAARMSLTSAETVERSACGARVFLFVRIGRSPAPVSVLY